MAWKAILAGIARDHDVHVSHEVAKKGSFVNASSIPVPCFVVYYDWVKDKWILNVTTEDASF